MRWMRLRARSTVAAGRSAAAGGEEHRDEAVGLHLVIGVRRECRDGALPPGCPLLAGQLADRHVERLGAILDHDGVRVGLEVVVPDRVGGRPALGGDQQVLAVVLHAHERRLAQLAALIAAAGDDDHGKPGVAERIGLLAARGLVSLHLIADPLGGAGDVLAFETHEQTICRPLWPGRASLMVPARYAIAGAAIIGTGRPEGARWPR